MYYGTKETVLGTFLIVGDDKGISQVNCQTGKKAVEIKEEWIYDFGKIKNVADQIEAYTLGKLRKFDVPIAPEGTDFQITVWEELLKIPYGETASYIDIAKAIGKPKAARAVGKANSKNPIQIIIPCHRIIGSNKTLIGYAGGLKMKKRLLQLERGVSFNNKISEGMDSLFNQKPLIRTGALKTVSLKNCYTFIKNIFLRKHNR